MCLTFLEEIFPICFLSETTCGRSSYFDSKSQKKQTCLFFCCMFKKKINKPFFLVPTTAKTRETSRLPFLKRAMAQQPGPPEVTWHAGSPGVALSAEDDSGLEDGDDVCGDHGNSGLARSPNPHGEKECATIFVAFKGNLDDADFQQKLDTILNGMPHVLSLGECALGV